MIDDLVFKTSLSKKDIDEIERITRATGFFSEEEVSIAVELAQDSLTNSSSTYKFLILERGNKIIAYTCYGKIPATEASFDLYWIVTDKDYQGQGIGKYIINKTHNLIRTLGGRLLYAETSGLQKYASTRKFYLSCAYKEAAVLKDFYKPNDDKYIYEYRL
jgi:GNAT superfamily N-acetyltransferase